MAEAALKQEGTPSNPPPEPHKGKSEKAKPAAEAGDAGRAWPDKAAAADSGTLAKPLAENRWSLREFRDPGHHVVLERGTPYEAVFEPSFWANIATKAKLQPGQSVRVVNDELTLFADLVVLDCGRNWATMAEYYKRTLDELVRSRPPLREQQRHAVGFAGPIDKWRIVRADNQVIRAGFESENAAQAYLSDYLRRLGA
jgi:hypothetical protein